MRNIKKLVAKVLIVGVVAGLFAGYVTVCSSVGSNMKEKQVAAEYKAREREYKIGFAEKVGQAVEQSKVVEKQKNLEKLQKDLEKDYQIHKNDKPVQATTRELTKDEKDNLGRG